MNLVLNLIWVVFGGFLIWLQYMVGGLLLCLTVVGIPFGLQCFKLAWLALLPFGKDVYDDPQATTGGPVRGVMNIVWLLVAGIWIFITHLTLAVGYAVTIIGLPFALQHLKLGILSLTPFGKSVR